jgi:hypothetical protein
VSVRKKECCELAKLLGSLERDDARGHMWGHPSKRISPVGCPAGWREPCKKEREGKMGALYMCKRSVKERAARSTRRFTVKEIEPFLRIEYRRDACDGGSFCAILGVAIQKENGTWGTHELIDETEASLSHRIHAGDEPNKSLENKAVPLMKKRLVGALNRLSEHYARVYVYPVASAAQPPIPSIPPS